jgi:hypothetical protein
MLQARRSPARLETGMLFGLKMPITRRGGDLSCRLQMRSLER